MIDRPLTRGEELANTLSHGVGFLLAVFVALPLLVSAGWHQHDAWQLFGGIIFGVTLALLYATSTLYHLVPPGRAKRFCRLLDHAAIYLLIAGTYTPFALGALRGPQGWSLLIIVWTLAALGVALKLKVGFRFPRLSTAIYLSMGWLVLIVIRPLIAQIGLDGFGWVLAGGLCYTVGGGIFSVGTTAVFAFLLARIRARWKRVSFRGGVGLCSGDRPEKMASPSQFAS